jgi:predicted NBD/HSP70 family sugar kinase
VTNLVIDHPAHLRYNLELTPNSRVRVLVFVTPGTTRVTVTGLGNEILVTQTGETVHSHQFTTHPGANQHLQVVAAEILKRVHKLGPEIRIAEVGVAVAGQISPDRSHITLAGRLAKQGWLNYPVAGELQALLAPISVNPSTGPKVQLINDAVARAKWESLHHPVVAGQRFFALYWGVGLGLAMSYPDQVSGKIVVTPYEFGHTELPARFADRCVPCDCGGYGHLEAWSGGGNLGDGLIGRVRLSSLDLTSKDNADRWRLIVRPVAAALAKILAEAPVPYLVLGGQRALDMHPHIRMLLPELLKEELGLIAPGATCPDVVLSDLYLAPAFAAGMAFDPSFA